MQKLIDPILVTGAAGFIGSHLTETLINEGCRVRAVVHYNSQNNWGWLEEVLGDRLEHPSKRTSMGPLFSDLPSGGSLEVVAGDVRDPGFVDSVVKGCRTVFHLAALISIPYSYMAPASFVDTNVKGTLNVLQACLNSNVSRVVHTSTSEVYGTAQYIPIDEKHPVVGQSPYSASKIGADHLAESYFRSFDLPVSIIRPFNTFGPRQSARGVIPNIITQALSGFEVIHLGSLEPIRDFTYVKDMVSGFLAVAASEQSLGRVMNVGWGDGISVGNLAKLILDVCGSNAGVETDTDRVRPEKSEVLHLVCDNSLSRERLGWEPRYSLREGLEETVDWMKARLHLYKPAIYNL